MDSVKNSKCKYYAISGGIFIRNNHEKYEILSGTKDSLQWKNISDISELSRMLSSDGTRLENEEKAKEWYLKYRAEQH